MTATFRIAARRECKFCHGNGTVTDYVDYGSTVAGMDSDCDACVEAGWPDDADDDVEYELVPWDYETPASGIACQSGNHEDCSGENCGCWCHHERLEFSHGDNSDEQPWSNYSRIANDPAFAGQAACNFGIE